METLALADQFGRVHMRVHRLVDQAMRVEGESLARTKLLLFIRHRGGAVRAKDIAEFFGFAPRTITEGIDGLERDGLVRRAHDPDDRRARIIELTDAGKAALERSQGPRERTVDAVLSALSPQERQAMSDMLAKIDGRLDELGSPPPCAN